MHTFEAAQTKAIFSSLIRRRPLVSYFFFAFLFSWGVRAPAIFIPDWPELLSFLFLLGPAFAALTMTLITGDRTQLAAMFRSLFQWKVGIQWYLAALLIPLMLIAGLFFTSQLLLPSDALSLQASAFGPALFLFISNFLYLMILVWGEEMGWRGYALPRLQANLHPLAASAVLGLLWGIWHLPNFWIPGSMQQMFPIPVYLLYILGHTFIYSWIYNGSKGSLLLVCIHHAATNAFLIAFAVFPGFRAMIQHSTALLLVMALADLTLILLTRSRLLKS